MFECSHCLNWLHYDCVGFIGSQEQAEAIEEFICPDCYLRLSEDKRQDIEEKYAGLFGVRRVKYNPYL